MSSAAKDFSHLDALQGRLAREKAKLAIAKTETEKAFRLREIDACEREIANEYKFLGIEPVSLNDIIMSDDELLRELSN